MDDPGPQRMECEKEFAQQVQREAPIDAKYPDEHGVQKQMHQVVHELAHKHDVWFTRPTAITVGIIDEKDEKLADLSQTRRRQNGTLKRKQDDHTKTTLLIQQVREYCGAHNIHAQQAQKNETQATFSVPLGTRLYCMLLSAALKMFDAQHGQPMKRFQKKQRDKQYHHRLVEFMTKRGECNTNLSHRVFAALNNLVRLVVCHFGKKDADQNMRHSQRKTKTEIAER
mmetsp:Transcript_54471/g.90276  ORF Transcript_54471/g.90276 Transcript_54471/m.90276 type:complete len:227 (-) Transcript_54471:196-876(-)